jgi:hypothetical protein
MRQDDHLIFEALQSKQQAREQEHAPHGYPGGITAIQNVLINQLKKHGFTLTKISHADKDRDKYPTVFMMRSKGPMHNVVEICGMGSINGEPYEDYLNNLKAYAQDDADVMLKNDGPGRIQDGAEDAEGVSAAFHYDPLPGLMKAAHEIRDILHGAANDEARTEHIIKMAQTILGDPTEYDKNEYRKMLDGLIVLLNRFIVVPMN